MRADLCEAQRMASRCDRDCSLSCEAQRMALLRHGDCASHVRHSDAGAQIQNFQPRLLRPGA